MFKEIADLLKNKRFYALKHPPDLGIEPEEFL
jgi:hypothetical protein